MTACLNLPGCAYLLLVVMTSGIVRGGSGRRSAGSGGPGSSCCGNGLPRAGAAIQAAGPPPDRPAGGRPPFFPPQTGPAALSSAERGGQQRPVERGGMLPAGRGPRQARVILLWKWPAAGGQPDRSSAGQPPDGPAGGWPGRVRRVARTGSCGSPPACSPPPAGILIRGKEGGGPPADRIRCPGEDGARGPGAIPEPPGSAPVRRRRCLLGICSSLRSRRRRPGRGQFIVSLAFKPCTRFFLHFLEKDKVRVQQLILHRYLQLVEASSQHIELVNSSTGRRSRNSFREPQHLTHQSIIH